MAGRPERQQIRVGDQPARDRDRVAVAARDRAGHDRGRLEAARAEHRDRDRLLDGAGVGEVRALDVLGGIDQRFASSRFTGQSENMR